MNEVAKAIVEQINKAKSDKEKWDDWSRRLMDEIRDALHKFHGKGKICVVSVQGGVERKNKVEVHHDNQFRFTFELKEGYIQFDHCEQQCAWAFNDPCERTERSLKGLAITHMARVIMEQTKEVVQQCEDL